MKTFKIVGIAIIVGFVALVIIVGKHTEMKYRAIVDDVRPLLPQCKRMVSVPIVIRGEILSWDMDNDWEAKEKAFSSNIDKAISARSPITVFMIFKRQKQVGVYSVSKKPAYRQIMKIFVAYWPEKKAVGTHTLYSEPPPETRRVMSTPGYGSTIKAFRAWLRSLPRKQ